MRSLSTSLFSLAGLALVSPLSAAEGGVSPSPYILFDIGGFPVTNSMAMSWVISLILILTLRTVVAKPRLIPTKGQAVVESVVGGLRDTLEPIVGKRMIGPVFPLLIGFFTFILIHNWSGLLPGVGNFGYVNEAGELKYFMRPGNADLNTTLALAVVHFGAWFYFIMRYAGPGMVMYDLFGNKADKKEIPLPIYLFLFLIFAFVGLIEVVSIAFRNISLPFRLYGNVYGGESLLTAMTGLVNWIIPVPFYFLEILIGFVQALVFTLLVAVYIGLICNHEGGDDHAHAH